MSEIGLMLAARYPLLYLVSPEEETAEEELVAIAQNRKSPIYFWDMSRGWDDKPGADKGNVMSALTRVAKAPNNQPAVFVLKDLATLIAPGNNGQITAGQLPIVREIKNLAREMARDRRCLVLLSDQLRLPLEVGES